MDIPIQNLYYLLCYAWDKLEEKNQVAVDIDDHTDLLNLLTTVLITGTRKILKRGIDRSYILHTDEHSGIKGKLELSSTVKSRLHLRQRAICTFDELSVNTLPNKILSSTLQKLLKVEGVNSALKTQVKNLLILLPDIGNIEISQSIFKQIRLNRNNRFYGFLLNVCELIHQNLLPAERHGVWKFADFTRDERKMNKVFEAFIRNFYKIEQSVYKVRREEIEWQLEGDVYALEFIPEMETDITLEKPGRKIIIDAKYYRETMKVRYGKEKIHSGNLFQMFSYLMNQRNSVSRTSQSTSGILIYPTVTEDYSLDYAYEGHALKIRTLNLNQHWSEISSRLLSIVDL